MKTLQLLPAMLCMLIILACSSNDDNSNNENSDLDPISEEQGLRASINGGTYSDYNFSETIYQITKGTTGNTISIDAGDANGNQLTLFMNETGGFDTGAVKDMGNTDTNNFVTYVLIRQSSPQISYFSTSGSINITANRAHPTQENQRLISGTFNINASSIIDPIENTTMSGTFVDLIYNE